MRILLLTQVLPYPPDSGPKVKTWNVLKFLAARHEVTLASFVRGDQSADVAVLRRYCARVEVVPMHRSRLRDTVHLAHSLLTGQPFLMLRDDVAAMRHLVERLTAEAGFDLVHADQLNMAQYALRVPDTPRLLDAHNAVWLLFRRQAAAMRHGPGRWLLEREWRLLRSYEGSIVEEFDAVTAVSEEDRAALDAASRHPAPMAVIPIAIDTDEVPVIPRAPGASRIVHVGTMYWPPNIDGILWFASAVLPLVRARHPRAGLDIVGARPPQSVVALAQDPGIEVTGYVADTTGILEQAAAFIVPLRAGGGMRVKILNALAQGLPVVTTSLGAEGIAVEHGKHLLVADTAEEFALAVSRLLGDPELARTLGQQGRALVEARYDYRQVLSPLDALYQRITGARRR